MNVAQEKVHCAAPADLRRDACKAWLDKSRLRFIFACQPTTCNLQVVIKTQRDYYRNISGICYLETTNESINKF